MAEPCVGDLNNVPAMGIIDGYAGVGLTLLTLIDKCSMEWTNLIPLFLEKNRKSSISDSANKIPTTNLFSNNC
jgi:hypothetical protein